MVVNLFAFDIPALCVLLICHGRPNFSVSLSSVNASPDEWCLRVLQDHRAPPPVNLDFSLFSKGMGTVNGRMPDSESE